MSLIGAARMVALEAVDKRHADEEWADNEDLFQPPPLGSSDWNATAEARGWVSPWWPTCSGLMGGGLTGDVDTCMIRRAATHTDIWRSFGSNGRLAFVGYTRDAYGSPVGGCTVRVFVTSTNELVSRVVSDTNGRYEATSPYFVAHYLVVHKTGAPDIAGASVDTLTPS